MSASLYRALDPEGRPLYIGFTLDGRRRLAEHGSRSDWWLRVGTVEIQHYATREDAMNAEAEAVRRERPEFNRRMPNFVPTEDELAARREARDADAQMVTVACTGCKRAIQIEAEIARLAGTTKCRCGGYWTMRQAA